MLNDGDCVYFTPHVGGIVSIIIIAVTAIAAIVVALSVKPPEIADTPEPDAVFDLKGQKNQIRLGSPIEDGYGRVRLWPSYATRPYNQYYGNDQFQFQLFCLGHGSWDIEAVQIEDTPIGQFQETEYEIYQPNEQVTLFPDNVETSSEVGQIELYAPNESEHAGHTGPFVVNSVNTLTNHIEVDVDLPRGLYFANGGGGLNLLTATALFQYREVGTTTWHELADFSKTLNTNTPQRYTLQKDVPEGRYEVQAIRTNNAVLDANGDKSHRTGNTIRWVGLRAFLPSKRLYGDVTMLAVKARATNNLNDSSANKINVIATRKLPTYNTQTGVLAAVNDIANRSVNRSPIWAMVNILRSKHGGNLDDRFLDLEFFAQEAQIADTAGIYFDWIFDQRTTVWEAVKLPCFVNKAIPMLNGSRVSFVRDKPTTLPTFFINPENTIKNSFKLEKKLYDLQAPDGLEVEYTDPSTWKPEVVLCLLTGELGNVPKRIKLQGVTDRQRAFDLGMYLWYKESKEREQVTVKTGLEGYIPAYGDIVRIGSDIPRWGQNGFIESIVGNVVTLSENVTFTDGQTHQLAIRGKLGQDLGPYTVTKGDKPNQVLMASTVPNGQLFFDFNNEPPYFTFGVSSIVGKICRVVDLNPQNGDGVTIKAIVDDQGRFTNFGTAPAINAPTIAPTIPDNPVVESINVSPIPDSTTGVTVSWTPALGAVNYILQKSTNGTDWVDVDAVPQTNYTLPIVAGTLHVRVAGVNVGIGAFVSWTGEVGAPTGVPSNVTGAIVQPAFTGVVANIKWQPAPQATSYEVKIFTDDENDNEVLRCTHEVFSTGYDFTVDEANNCGGKNRNITFKVKGKNALGVSEIATELTVTNPIPPALSGVSSTLKSDDGTTRIYSVSWDVLNAIDISQYKVWASTTQGFTADNTTQVFSGLASSFDISVTDTGSGFPNMYWRAAAVDLWGDEVNLSPEQTI